MPESVRAPEVNQNAERTHDDSGDGDGFADDHHFVHVFIIVKVGGDDHHDSTGRKSDSERKVRDIESPTDVVGHIGDNHALRNLMSPRVRSDQGDGRQDDHPDVESKATVGCLPQSPPQEAGIAANRMLQCCDVSLFPRVGGHEFWNQLKGIPGVSEKQRVPSKANRRSRRSSASSLVPLSAQRLVCSSGHS